MFISKPVLIFIGFMYIAGLFFHLGYKPFNSKESKYAIASIESSYNSNYLNPSVIGKPFIEHPPLYIILESLIFHLTKPSEFSARLISVFSFLAIGWLIQVSILDIVGFEASLFAAVGFLVSFGIYYSISATPYALFSFFIFLSMISVFLFEKSGVLVGCILTFLAFSTYGFSSFVFFYLFLLVYGYLDSKARQYILSKEHLLGIIISLFAMVLYFLLISKGNIHKINYILGFFIIIPFKNLLSSMSISNVLTHSITSLLKAFYYSLPFSFIFFTLFKKEFRSEFIFLIKDNKRIKRLIVFLTSAFSPNFFLFSFLPNTEFDTYVWLVAFMAMFAGVLFYEVEYMETLFDFKKIAYIAFFAFFILSLFCFIFDLEFINSKDYLILGAILIVSVIFFPIVKRIQDNLSAMFVLLVLLSILCKFLYSSSYVAYIKNYQRDYEKYANGIARIVLKNKPEYVMSDGGNLKLFFYLERKLKMPIYSFKNNRYGIVITKNRQRVAILKGAIDTPNGVYYIGIKNGGV